MRALTFESFARPAAPVGRRHVTKPKPQSRRWFARVRGALLFTLAAGGAAAAIIAIRVLFWAIGHPDQPFFREISRLWS